MNLHVRTDSFSMWPQSGCVPRKSLCSPDHFYKLEAVQNQGNQLSVHRSREVESVSVYARSNRGTHTGSGVCNWTGFLKMCSTAQMNGCQWSALTCPAAFR